MTVGEIWFGPIEIIMPGPVCFFGGSGCLGAGAQDATTVAATIMKTVWWRVFIIGICW